MSSTVLNDFLREVARFGTSQSADHSLSFNSPVTTMERPTASVTLFLPHRKSFLPKVEDLVDVRLRSSWGRPVHPVPSGTTSAMHEMIAMIRDNDTNVTERYVLQNQWRRVQLRCETHPFEAGCLDRRGRTCLHAACAKKAPLAAINSILAACGRHGEAVLERDKHGRTPLAIAISSNSSLSVISRLIKTCHRAAAVGDHNGHLPIHLACSGYDHGKLELVKLLLEAYPESAGRESNTGRTPLHIAIETNASVHLIRMLVISCPKAVVMSGCGLNPLFLAIRRNVPPEVIRCLVDANPSSTMTRDRCDGFPLRRAVEQQAHLSTLESLITCPEVVTDADPHLGHTVLHNAFECGIPRDTMVDLLVRTAPSVATQRNRTGQTPLSLACQRFLRVHRRRQVRPAIWKSLCTLLKAAYYNRVLDSDPLVHAAVGLGLSPLITEYVLKEFPEQIRVQDSRGDFPLVSALKSPSQANKTDLVLKLLCQHRDAATTPSSNGRSVLSVAAEATAIAPKILTELVVNQPEALWKLDPVHKMYPFMVAAVPKPKVETDALASRIRSQWDDKVDEDALQLSAIFTLLVSEPTLI